MDKKCFLCSTEVDLKRTKANDRDVFVWADEFFRGHHA